MAYAGLSAGTHTLSIKGLGTHHANSGDQWIYLDYIDVWDGTAMADGQFESTDQRVQRTTNWNQGGDAAASGGGFVHDGSNLWFPFTGESVTVQGLATNWAGQGEHPDRRRQTGASST